MQFFLGTHMTEFSERTDVPLFMSARRLRRRRRSPRALGPWALDSGGFSEIAMFGAWQTSPQQYVAEVRRWSQEIGNMAWAAIQDWMCEPFMLAKTGLSIEEHQRRTVWSYLALKSLAPEIHWVPVLQGWEPDDYLRHVEMYERALPWPLSRFRLVGVGSVCRRQRLREAVAIFRPLYRLGLKLHGFGLKTLGLPRLAKYLVSADSMAWSRWYRFDAARRLPGHTHKTCANCLPAALVWRERLLRGDSDETFPLFAEGA